MSDAAQEKAASPTPPEAKKPQGRPPVNDRISSIEKSVNDLTKIVMNIAESLSEKPKQAEAKQPTPMEKDKESRSANAGMIPSSWLAVVHTHLGREFDYELTEGAHGSFGLKILFPSHLDRRVGTERTQGARDCSMASPIRLASPVADLEQWCKLIVSSIKKAYPNFLPKV